MQVRVSPIEPSHPGADPELRKALEDPVAGPAGDDRATYRAAEQRGRPGRVQPLAPGDRRRSISADGSHRRRADRPRRAGRSTGSPRRRAAGDRFAATTSSGRPGRGRPGLGKGRLAVHPAGPARRQRPAHRPELEALAQVATVEPGAQEARIERVAGARRVDRLDRHRGDADDGSAGRRERSSLTELDGDDRPAIGPSGRAGPRDRHRRFLDVVEPGDPARLDRVGKEHIRDPDQVRDTAVPSVRRVPVRVE